MQRSAVALRAINQSDHRLLAALFISALLHAGAFFAAVHLGGCVCHYRHVVCPQQCAVEDRRIDLQLAAEQPPPPPPPTPERPKPEPTVVVASPKPEAPPAAPKAGQIVLPPEALVEASEPQGEIVLDAPSLPEEAVVVEGEAAAPFIATAEIFSRVEGLVWGAPGTFGLGGTGEATGTGGFGSATEGSGQGGSDHSAAPVSPVAEPAVPRGPTRPPRVSNWTDPPYPEQARQQGVEGETVLRLSVAADGRPEDVRIYRSSGHRALDAAAAAHARERLRFSPALEDGEPVPMTITFRVRFRLVNT